jgi:hypothetical protein
MIERIAQGRVLDVERDDGGQSLIVELSFEDDNGLFVRVMSWSEEKNHPTFDQMRGKKIKVVLTVEEE